MRLRIVLATSAMFGFPLLAAAQPVDGLYVGAGALWNYKQAEHVQASPGVGFGSGSRLDFDAGGVGGLGSVGYGLGNGLRAEIEGSYRQNSLRGFTGQANPHSGDRSTQQDYGVMANVLYDLNLKSLGVPNYVTPYVGLGAGWQWSHVNGFNSTNAVSGSTTHIGGTGDNFAYQGIVGVAFPISAVPGLALTTEYRFLGVLGNETFKARNLSNSRTGNFDISENLNHSVVVGVRYAFNQPAPPAPAPIAAPQPVVAPARTYLVFFDWDRADLTDRARQIIADAAQASSRVQSTRIEVQGNADRSGTPAYNQQLSLRRAQTVAAELVRDGVARSAINIQAFGDTRPLVPTAAGVREPQNRRVEIILR